MKPRPLVDTLETWPVMVLTRLIRHGLDDDKIKSLVQALMNGQSLPAVFVLSDGGSVQILDGHHRTAAWHAAGIADAPVIVFRPR